MKGRNNSTKTGERVSVV